MFKRGLPPAGLEAAWLLLGDGDGAQVVWLCVHDGELWCESGDWRGESAGNPIADDGYVVLGWKEHVIPAPVFEPYAVYDVFTSKGHFLQKRAAASESEAIRLARLDGDAFAAVAQLAAGESCPGN